MLVGFQVAQQVSMICKPMKIPSFSDVIEEFGRPVCILINLLSTERILKLVLVINHASPFL